MSILKTHTGKEFYRETQTTISEDNGYTVVEIRDRQSLTTIKFRKCLNMPDSTLQFQCDYHPFGKRGKFISFCLPGALVDIFMDRLGVPYAPPR